MVRFFFKQIEKNKTFIKFGISGATSALTHFVILYTLTELGLWYIASASIGFFTAFLISFHMQKFWTFRDGSRDRIANQMLVYFGVALTGMLLNAGGMYLLVEYTGIYYIFAQVILSAFIAIGNYLMYRFVIFKNSPATDVRLIDPTTKILLATGIFPPDIGGPATYVKTLSEELPSHGYEVTVLTYANKSEIVNRRSARLPLRGTSGQEIVNRGSLRLPLGSARDRRSLQFGGQAGQAGVRLVKVWREQNVLFRYLKYFWKAWCLTREADIVYAQDAVSAGLPACLACYIRGKEFLLKIVGDYAWEQGQGRCGLRENIDEFQTKKFGFRIELWRWLQRGVAKQAKQIITPSEYLKNIVKLWGINEGKIRVINNAVNIPAISESRANLRQKLGINGFTLLTAGRLVPWKGMDLLIDVIRDLTNVQLIIIGDGPEKDNLQLQITNYKLEDQVKMTGSIKQDELWEYMKASDSFVLNTGYEGLPHVTIEAMMLGLPVITTLAGGNREVVENGRNGILVEYNNKNAIKNAIEKLKNNNELRDELSARAILIKERFNKDKMVKEVVGMFSGLAT